jgi:hypothetical protein
MHNIFKRALILEFCEVNVNSLSHAGVTTLTNHMQFDLRSNRKKKMTVISDCVIVVMKLIKVRQ